MRSLYCSGFVNSEIIPLTILSQYDLKWLIMWVFEFEHRYKSIIVIMSLKYSLVYPFYNMTDNEATRFGCISWVFKIIEKKTQNLVQYQKVNILFCNKRHQLINFTKSCLSRKECLQGEILIPPLFIFHFCYTISICMYCITNSLLKY